MSPTRMYALIGVIVFVILCVILAPIIGFVWTYLLSINLVTFAAYGYDKSIASSSVTRVPEKLLHLLSAVGGSPAGFAAQNVFAHKRRKPEFMRVFWATVVLQVILIAVLFVVFFLMR